jgi:hypothetical protein
MSTAKSVIEAACRHEARIAGIQALETAETRLQLTSPIHILTPGVFSPALRVEGPFRAECAAAGNRFLRNGCDQKIAGRLENGPEIGQERLISKVFAHCE